MLLVLCLLLVLLDRRDLRFPQPAGVKESNNKFALTLQKTSQGNMFWSPVSVSTAMAMLYAGARGLTAREISHALSYHSAGLNIDRINQQLKEVLDSQVGGDHIGSLEYSNAMFCQKGSAILPEYKEDLQYYYGALIKELDFGYPEEAVEEVNGWISNKTHGKIPNLLESLEADTVLVLLNAVHFTGLWLSPFLPAVTRKQKFYNNGTTAVDVNTMFRETELPYGNFPDHSLRALKLPYQGGRFSMIVLLPLDRNGLWEVEQKLTSDTLDRITHSLKTENVIVALPKFKLQCSMDLKHNLQMLGVGVAFTDNANFGRINGEGNLKVSSVIHHAKVEVNEAGTDASAAVGAVVIPYILEESFRFIAEHPFLFFIMDEENGMILFSGRVVHL